jgi:hypothetical protein
MWIFVGSALMTKVTSTPLPLNNKKKKEKNQPAPTQVPSSHNE